MAAKGGVLGWTCIRAIWAEALLWTGGLARGCPQRRQAYSYLDRVTSVLSASLLPQSHTHHQPVLLPRSEGLVDPLRSTGGASFWALDHPQRLQGLWIVTITGALGGGRPPPVMAPPACLVRTPPVAKLFLSSYMRTSS